jgi:hypothetical protein
MVCCQASSLGIVTSLGAGTGTEARFLVEAHIFLFSKTCRHDLRPTQPAIQWIPGQFPPAKNRPGCEDDLALPSGVGMA